MRSHFAGQALPSSSVDASDPLAGVPPDQAFVGGLALGTAFLTGLFAGGALLYAMNPRLGIPRWSIALIGALGGGFVGTAIGMRAAGAAMPAIQQQVIPTLAQLQAAAASLSTAYATGAITPPPSASSAPATTSPPQSSSYSTIGA